MKRFPAFLFWLFALGVLILDQITKGLVLQRLPLQEPKDLAPFLSLTHVHNTGASFGMFPDSNRAFVVMTAAILLVLAFLHRRLASEGRLTAFGLALLWAGALGNLIDRLRFGFVVDFLDFHWGARHWPAFNVADGAITAGVTLMLLENLRRDRRQDAAR